jgi:hypothetical protein
MRMIPSSCDSDYGCCASVVLEMRNFRFQCWYLSDHTQGPFTRLSAQNGWDGKYSLLVVLEVRGAAQHTSPASKPLARDAAADD